MWRGWREHPVWDRAPYGIAIMIIIATWMMIAWALSDRIVPMLRGALP